jgi:PiT family inorganic phosphate transporter
MTVRAGNEGIDVALLTVIGIVAVALLFDYTNGFHDSANSISTIVATPVLRPRLAVLWAAFFNFIAFVFFGTKVATPSSRPSSRAMPAWP